MFKFEAIPIDDVYAKGKDRYNSNNHWPDNIRPEDYMEVLSKSYTVNWVNKFHSHYMVLNFDIVDIVWLRAAHRIAQHTGRFPSYFSEELRETVSKYARFNTLVHKGEWFVRSEKCSLKYGQHGAGPYCDLKDVVESLVSSIYGHTPVDDDCEELRLYFFPWQKIQFEFRVFVCNRRITCISQQDIYVKCKYSEEQVHEFCTLITTYFEENIKEKFTHLESYSIDICVLDNKEVYFIEINSFGREYAAGSALFHWLHDSNLLEGVEASYIHIRYVV